MVTCPTPAMPCAAPRDRDGVPKIVSEAVAELPDASVTAMAKESGAVPAGIITATPVPGGMLPFASDSTLDVFAKLIVLYHVVAAPPRVMLSAELAANPAPLIGTTAGALTAVIRFRFSVVLKVMFALTVKVAVAAAVPAVTVTVWAPLGVKVVAGMLVL